MKKCSLFVVVSMFSVQVLAATPDMRPGLWKHSYAVTDQTGQMEIARAQMKEYLDQLPPEHRQMAEEMMGQAPSAGLLSGSSEECITAEQIASGMWMNREDDCKDEIIEQSSKKIHVKFSCKDDSGTAYRGEGEVVFHSPTRHTGKVVMIVDINGATSRTEMETKGEWLAADCGDVEPDY